MLYHNEVYMPEKVLAIVKNKMANMKTVRFSRHVQDWLNGTSGEDCLREKKHTYTKPELMKALSNILRTQPVPFEVEVQDGEVVKFVVRLGMNENQDISIAVGCQNGYIIKTAWVNNKEDIHCTLDTSKYVKKV